MIEAFEAVSKKEKETEILFLQKCELKCSIVFMYENQYDTAGVS